ncbi:MAG: hypothetical protein KHW49_02895 [Eubacterium sp.]|jgi:hypothetical protein|nr:hypothetical protein [Eubacterium sp.]
MEFSLKNFVMKTLKSMKDSGEEEYKINQYALKYFERNVLKEEDLAEVESWFIEKDYVDDGVIIQPDGIN